MKYPLAYTQSDYTIRNIGDKSALSKWKNERKEESQAIHLSVRERLLQAATKVNYFTLASWGKPRTFRLFGFDIVVYRRSTRV